MFSFMLAALLLISPTGHVSSLDKYGIEVPPAAYDHTPRMPVIRIYLPADQVDSVCTLNIGIPQVACTRTDSTMLFLLRDPYLPAIYKEQVSKAYINLPNLCVLILPMISKKFKVTQDYRQHLVRHENAHCNGVVHDGQTGLGWYTLDGKPVR